MIIRHFSALGKVLLLEEWLVVHLLGVLLKGHLLQVPHLWAVPGELLGVVDKLHSLPLPQAASVSKDFC